MLTILILNLLGAAYLWLLLQNQMRITDHLKFLQTLESAPTEQGDAQAIATTLAILGRDHEVRSTDIFPQFDFPAPDVDVTTIQIKPLPWKTTIQEIAADHRLVMVMESHFSSRDREWIGAALPIFKEQGFTHYAVEAIGESSKQLKSRGYPSIETGYYTCDPQFANSIRTALELRLEVLGYDFRPFSHEMREEYAADQLAKILNGNNKAKLLVHAGPGHILKHKTELNQKWLAARLWEKTGVEPITIWQWSDLHDEHDYRIVASAIRILGPFEEPVILMPPPEQNSGLNQIPKTDAILVHPKNESVAPNHRSPLFAQNFQNAVGTWTGKKWPVIIAAFHVGEPDDAIALDQVLLRNAEDQFNLLIPQKLEFDVRAFGTEGRIEIEVVIDADQLILSPK